MKVEEFTDVCTAEYMSIFHPEKKSKISPLDRISEFLFKPRYEVNNLKFNTIA